MVLQKIFRGIVRGLENPGAEINLPHESRNMWRPTGGSWVRDNHV